MKKTIAVLFGGRSSEHEVSKLSAANVISALTEGGRYYVLPVYITKDGRWILYDGTPEGVGGANWDMMRASAVLSPDVSHGGLLRIVGDKVRSIPVDVIFPVLHGKNGEDGTIQGLCELAGIPCVGCGTLASAVSMDKEFTNIVVRAAGIGHTPWLAFRAPELADMGAVCKRVRYKLGYPCFVKPACAGSSVGISKVSGKSELVAAIRLAAEHGGKVIVEKAVAGRELECAVLGNDEPEASSVGEIVCDKGFYDYDAKYNSAATRTVVPADIPPDVAETVRGLAVKAFKAVDGSGMARVDFFLRDETGEVYLNEINTIPGFTAISLYPALWADAGVTVSELADRLVSLAAERGGER